MELVPLTQLRSDEVAQQVNRLVSSAKVSDQLQQRHMLGVIARYGGDLGTALFNIIKAYYLHKSHKLGAFAIMNNLGNVRGLASVQPNLRLNRLRVPLPPVATVGPLKQTYHELLNPQVAAWTAGTNAYQQRTLADAYRQLRNLAWDYKPNNAIANVSTTWTLEPLRSPEFIHASILDAGFIEAEKARFDDQESRKVIPPVGILYIGDRRP